MVKTPKITNLLALAMALLLGIFSVVTPVSAGSAGEDGIGFSVSAVLPENQITPETGYFELKVSPKHTQKLEVVIKNTSQKEKTIQCSVNNVSTTPLGEIDYTTPDVKDESLKYPFAEMASVEAETVKVPAKSSVSTYITVTLPEEEFDGVVLGSIKLTDITARLENESKEDGQGIGILNEYEYVLAVLLRENDKEIAPDFKLLDIFTGLSNYQAAITVPIQNPTAQIMGDAIFDGAIYKKGSSEPIFSVTGDDFDIAPNSVMNYRFIDEKGYGISSGDYKFIGKVEYKGQTWDFEQDFTIEAEEAKTVNSAAINQTRASNDLGIPIWLVIITILGVILIVLLLLVLLKYRKSK